MKNQVPMDERHRSLEAYIHNYLVKRMYNVTAQTFQAEAALSTTVSVLDSAEGFLFEWWAVFWDSYIARYRTQVPGVASYNEVTQIIQEQQSQLQQVKQEEDLLIKMEIQMMKQLLEQTQQRDLAQSQHGIGIDTHARQQQKIEQQSQLQQVKQEEDLRIKMEIQKMMQSLEQREAAQRQHGTGIDTHAWLQQKMYEEVARLPISDYPLNEENIKPMVGDNTGPSLDSNHVTALDLLEDQSRYTPYATSGEVSGCFDQTQYAGFTDLPLRGWSSVVVDQLQPRLLRPQQPRMQSPQAWHQYQLQRQAMFLKMQQQQMQSNLAHQQQIHDSHAHQQQIQVSHAHQQQIQTSHAHRQQMQRIHAHQQQMQRSHAHQQQIQSSRAHQQHMQSSPAHQKHMLSSPAHQKQYRQGALLDQQSQASNYHLQKQDNMVGAGIIAAEDSLFSTSEENDQASNMQNGEKKRRTEPSSSSTPSSHTVGDVLSKPCLTQSKGFSQPPCMFANTGRGKILASAENQLAQMGCLEPDQSVNDDGTFSRNDKGSRGVDTSEGSRFSETGSIHLKADCVDLSSKKYHLVTSKNKKAYLWWTKSRQKLRVFSEHSDVITDIRFAPTASWVATSSLDKTVRVWDVENSASSSFRTFVGHSGSVMSLDFHPEGDLVCSCDDTNEIRYWSIKKGGCARVSQASSSKVRFQPVLGRYIAGVEGSSISILDAETLQTCGNPLKSSALNVQAVCWNSSGELLASLSEDLIRIWKFGSGAQRDCVRELRLPAKKFRCCVFHPQYPLLAIGCSQSLECWNFEENKMMSPVEGPISALAASTMSGLASALENNGVKLWHWN